MSGSASGDAQAAAPAAAVPPADWQDYHQRWFGIWEAGLVPGELFDKGESSPQLLAMLRSGELDVRGKRVLVPGCGRGYDVCAFAAAGAASAVGLDICPAAVAAARAAAPAGLAGAPPGAAGAAQFEVADFFSWEPPGGAFDAGYDLTFLCALRPDMRPAWAAGWARLLAPGGLLVTVVYPVDASLDPGTGPPWPLTPDLYRDLLPPAGFELVSLEPVPEELSLPSRRGREWLGLWRRSPPRPRATGRARMAGPVADAEAPLLAPSGKGAWRVDATFGAPVAAVCCLALAAFAALCKYESAEGDVALYYPFLRDVLLMVFVGFGFLYTFLRAYACSGVGFNFLLSGLATLLGTLAVGAAQQGLLSERGSGVIAVDLPLLIDGAFCAGAAMIAYGAVIGRATPGQLVGLVLGLVPAYAANAALVVNVLGALDVGGSITIHAFGAYFGLAASRLLHTPGGCAGHPKNGAAPINDVTAMIGTTFLWVLWPSFNGALAITPGEADAHQFRCVANTLTALLGAVAAAAAASTLLTNKFDMVHVQNATLAGGVAIGSSANLLLPPAAALGVGMAAGVLSVAGYVWASPWVEATLRVQDTCGVNNLHGMPGILGGLASAAFCALPGLRHGNVGLMTRGAAQPLWQLAGLGATLCIASASGALTGLAMAKVSPVAGQALPVADMYDDGVFWHEAGSDGEDDRGVAFVLGALLVGALASNGAPDVPASRPGSGGGGTSGVTRGGALRAGVPDECTPGPTAEPRPAGMPVPPLPGGAAPNVLLLVTDDQGWDDIGLNNPRYVDTPHLDAFIRAGTLFDNYKTAPEVGRLLGAAPARRPCGACAHALPRRRRAAAAPPPRRRADALPPRGAPQCAQARAAVMTGRDHPRTGTLRTNGGYDFLHPSETTAGRLLGDAGWYTAHFGKWHNAEVAGYEPWRVGFNESWDGMQSAGPPGGPEAEAAGARRASAPGGEPAPSFLLRANGALVGGAGAAASPRGDSPADEVGLLEEALFNRTAQFLQRRAAAPGQPWFAYLAAHSIHTCAVTCATGAGSRRVRADARSPRTLRAAPRRRSGTRYDGRFRSYPAAYLAKLQAQPRYAGLPPFTLDAWAALAYLDDLLGRVLGALEATGLTNSTLVLITSDNGALQSHSAREARPPRCGRRAPCRRPARPASRPSVPPAAPRRRAQARMPSLMAGQKSTVLEGGVRTFLAARGPGVPAGEVDSTLLSASDVLPTLAELARVPADVTARLGFDGVSFANLLRAGPGTGAAGAGGGRRGTALATPEQQQRVVVSLAPDCWTADTVPLLGPDREVLKPQPLLDYDTGGLLRGWERCIAVHRGHYKWVGDSGKLYRFEGRSHVEAPCSEAAGPEAAAVVAELRAAARAWFAGVAASPHSFCKPVFFLGLPPGTATNVLAAGAHERTARAVALGPNGAQGPGRRPHVAAVAARLPSLQVATAGTYDWSIFATTLQSAKLRLSVGSAADIAARRAPSVTAELPASGARMVGQPLGALVLAASVATWGDPGAAAANKTEACLELVSRTSGQPVFKLLGALRAVLRTSSSAGAGAELAPALVQRFALPGGQQRGRDSPYSPYAAEGIAGCAACQPFV
ncbi:rhbg [Scenedesmus sp. PABB004]|nr:rhbg [Scenedesmus sp. PABB004]